jgi:hypothetical protein
VPQGNSEKEAKRKLIEALVQDTRASETVASPVAKAISQVQQRQKEEELETALSEGQAPNLSKDSKPLRWQLTETFEPTPESICTKNTWYVEYEVTGPPEQKEEYAGEVIQIPAVRGTAKSTNHKSNVLDLRKQMYPKATTLADIGITKAREAIILQAIAESYSVPQINPDKEATRKRLEAFVHETRASETVAKAIAQVQQQKKDSKPLYRQITETFEPTPESIWEEIDMLEGDPAHRGMAMRNARFKPFWLTAEASEWKYCGIKVSSRNGIAQTF